MLSIITLLSVLGFCITLSKSRSLTMLNGLLAFLSSILIVIYFGIRGDRGSDSEIYEIIFNELGNGVDYNFEPVYHAISLIFQSMFNYTLFQLCLVAFLIFSTLRLVKITPPIVVIIGLLVFILVENVGLQRQILSISFAFLSLSYLNNRVVFIILSLLAVGSHYSIIFFYIAYLFYLQGLFGKVLLVLGMGATSILIEKVFPLIGDGGVQSKLLEYSTSNYGFLGSDEVFYQGLLLRLLVVVYVFYHMKKLRIQNQQFIMFANMYVFGFFLYASFGNLIPIIATRGTMVFQALIFYCLFYLLSYSRWFAIPIILIVIQKIPRLILALESYNDHLLLPFF